MTEKGAGYVVSGEGRLVLFPGFAIMLAVLAFNLVGDTLRYVPRGPAVPIVGRWLTFRAR